MVSNKGGAGSLCASGSAERKIASILRPSPCSARVRATHLQREHSGAAATEIQLRPYAVRVGTIDGQEGAPHAQRCGRSHWICWLGITASLKAGWHRTRRELHAPLVVAGSGDAVSTGGCGSSAARSARALGPPGTAAAEHTQVPVGSPRHSSGRLDNCLRRSSAAAGGRKQRQKCEPGAGQGWRCSALCFVSSSRCSRKTLARTAFSIFAHEVPEELRIHDPPM